MQHPAVGMHSALHGLNLGVQTHVPPWHCSFCPQTTFVHFCSSASLVVSASSGVVATMVFCCLHAAKKRKSNVAMIRMNVRDEIINYSYSTSFINFTAF